jgi:hypothetical protein
MHVLHDLFNWAKVTRLEEVGSYFSSLARLVLLILLLPVVVVEAVAAVPWPPVAPPLVVESTCTTTSSTATGLAFLFPVIVIVGAVFVRAL